MNDTIHIQITRIHHRKADSGWCIIGTDQGKAVGVIEWEPSTGDQLELSGDWENSAYGQQFKFTEAKPHIPTDPRTMLHYATSITTGLGDARETEIWITYGPEWRNDPDLERIEGLSTRVRAAWAETLSLLVLAETKFQVIAWLMDLGATIKMAAAAWGLWAEQTQPRVMQDCYCLTELKGYGFQDVDRKIRVGLGIPNDDQRRYSAAMLYLLRRETKATGATAILYERRKSGKDCRETELVTEWRGMVGDVKPPKTVGRLVADARVYLVGGDAGLYLVLVADWESESVIWSGLIDVA